MTEPAIKVLSLWQPWASLVARGFKEYETRSWHTNYRGPLWIHATKGGLNRLRVNEMVNAMGWQRTFEVLNVAHPMDLPRGVILARTNLVDCLPTEEVVNIDSAEEFWGDWTPGRYAWKFEKTVRVYPVKATGSQGLWTPTKHEQHLMLSALRDAQ